MGSGRTLKYRSGLALAGVLVAGALVAPASQALESAKVVIKNDSSRNLVLVDDPGTWTEGVGARDEERAWVVPPARTLKPKEETTAITAKNADFRDEFFAFRIEYRDQSELSNSGSVWVQRSPFFVNTRDSVLVKTNDPHRNQFQYLGASTRREYAYDGEKEQLKLTVTISSRYR